MNEIVKSLAKLLTHPYFWLLGCFLLLLLARIALKKKYLNCIDILKNHLLCFEKVNGGISYSSIFVYFFIPFIIALALNNIRQIDDDVISILTIIVSILTAMFFTLLTVVLDINSKVAISGNKNSDGNKTAITLKLLRETYYSIMFEVLISTVILIFCFAELFMGQYNWLVGLIIYYLSFVMLMNLFMILKRVNKVIDEDLKRVN